MILYYVLLMTYLIETDFLSFNEFYLCIYARFKLNQDMQR